MTGERRSKVFPLRHFVSAANSRIAKHCGWVRTLCGQSIELREDWRYTCERDEVDCRRCAQHLELGTYWPEERDKH